MHFKVIPPITDVQTIAVGAAIREIERLRKTYGSARWRKCKGNARVQFADGIIVKAELHWYEAHGIGRKEIKIKRLIEDA
ncbi:MAG: hypothetical protein GC162_02545 [Planctomycetes bacterium]|nr:hypothetical protein [Planctomycetota bacterium]